MRAQNGALRYVNIPVSPQLQPGTINEDANISSTISAINILAASLTDES